MKMIFPEKGYISRLLEKYIYGIAIVLLFSLNVTAQQQVKLIKDTISPIDTLIFETSSIVRDNGSQWPNYYSHLTVVQDSLLSNKLIYDFTFDLSGTYRNTVIRKDTFQKQNIPIGNYTLIAFWTYVDSSNRSNPIMYHRQLSDTVNFIVRQSTSIIKNRYVVNQKIYPNPANQFISVEYFSNELVEIRDVGGRIVMISTLRNGNIDISTLPKGIYYLYLPTIEQFKPIKFVKS
jgi:hypothetical protein